MSGALSHLRVLDLSRVLAGPWCTQMLADLGADVIKIERPGSGDDSRHWGPPWVVDGQGRETRDSSYFTSANRNKRSLAVDLGCEAGRQLVRELACHCDVLVENFKVGDLERRGLGYDALRALNPGIVYCSITGYGQDGPYAARAGYDFMAQGEGGLMSINGPADSDPGAGPVKVAIAVTDIVTGLNAAVAILAALEHRHVSGRGQHIDVALLDSVVHFGANQIAGMFAQGEVPRRWGNAHPNLTPYQTFGTADAPIIVCAGNDGQFRRLCTVVGREDLGADPRFASMAGRNRHRAVLVEALQQALRERPGAHWVQRLAAAGVPCAPVNDYRQVFEHPQVRHRGLRVDQPHGDGGVVSTVANPIRLSGTPVAYRHAPPRLGEHGAAVLAQWLGKRADDIDALARDQVIGRLAAHGDEERW